LHYFLRRYIRDIFVIQYIRSLTLMYLEILKYYTMFIRQRVGDHVVRTDKGTGAIRRRLAAAVSVTAAIRSFTNNSRNRRPYQSDSHAVCQILIVLKKIHYPDLSLYNYKRDNLITDIKIYR
jgi:hypothetical protein